MIVGGYYIKARCIQNSDIATAPPYIREIWDWLLKEANHTDTDKIKRGQMIRTFYDIIDGLKWFVGYRKMTYNKCQCENAMRWLRNKGMITTMKTTRGLIITICNYDLYQDSKNYENNTKATTKTTRKQQGTDAINKKEKKEEETIQADWKNDYSIYKSETAIAFQSLENNPVFRGKIKHLYPNYHFERSMHLSFEYWGGKEGWANKKKRNPETIDWESTIVKNFEKSRSFYTPEEKLQLK
jgi:hypothetical protein